MKAEISRTPIPIPQQMAVELSAHTSEWPHGEHLLVSTMLTQVAPSTVQQHFRVARAAVPSLPPGFRFHDLRHASALTTLDTCGHLGPDSEDVTRSAVAALWRAPADNLRTGDADA